MIAASALVVSAVTSALLVADVVDAPPRTRTALVILLGADLDARRMEYADALELAGERSGMDVVRVVQAPGDARADAFELDPDLRARLEQAGVGTVAIAVVTSSGEGGRVEETTTAAAKRLGFDVLAVGEALKARDERPRA